MVLSINISSFFTLVEFLDTRDEAFNPKLTPIHTIIAFDTNKFEFITDDVKKMIAFNKILKSAQNEYAKSESDIIKEESEKEFIKDLIRKLN